MVLCLINKYTCPDQTKKIMDDIGLLYASSEWKNFDADTDLSKITIIPNSEEVDRIELRKRDDYARHNLESAKRKHANKMKTIKQKMAKVKDEQEQLETNLVKFNAFVKEKQLKVERGSKTEQEEKELREAMTEDIEQKEATMVELTEARTFLEGVVQKRKIYHDFLNTVVECDESRNRYKDIGELMKRCETLVATRDNLLETRDKIRSAIQKEEESLAQFKEEQNARILDLSARLNEMQEKYYSVEARRLEKQRLIDAEAKEDINKQLLIANIKLSILTLWQYVLTKKVVLPGDQRKSSQDQEDQPSKDKPPGLEDQLDEVTAHIEDLQVVIDRVQAADDIEGYNDPLLSEVSELRLDY